MQKIVDITRMILISPELLIGVFLSFIFREYSRIAELAYNVFQSEQTWPIAALLGIPIVLTVASYRVGSEILSPQGKRIILLEWPEYWRLKFRVVYSLIVCLSSFIGSLFGYYLIHEQKSVTGAVVIVIAWSVATTSLLSLALAKWKAREIIGE